jgi:hypothetical protein
MPSTVVGALIPVASRTVGTTSITWGADRIDGQSASAVKVRGSIRCVTGPVLAVQRRWRRRDFGLYQPKPLQFRKRPMTPEQKRDVRIAVLRALLHPRGSIADMLEGIHDDELSKCIDLVTETLSSSLALLEL